MTYQDNKIQFKVIQQGYALLYTIFRVDDFLITEGEDPKGNIYQGMETSANDGAPLNFRIGRHTSTTVANWFNARIPANQNTFGHSAGELNFALIGQLGLTLVRDDKSISMFYFDGVALAQGRSGSTNNWWFGGKNFYTLPLNSVSAHPNPPEDNYFFRFYRGENKVDEVMLELRQLWDKK